MIRTIGLEEVQKMKEDGAQIVDVLPSKEYSEQHIPGAINIPLLHMNGASVAVLDKNRPIIVYCWDYQ